MLTQLKELSTSLCDKFKWAHSGFTNENFFLATPKMEEDFTKRFPHLGKAAHLGMGVSMNVLEAGLAAVAASLVVLPPLVGYELFAAFNGASGAAAACTQIAAMTIEATSMLNCTRLAGATLMGFGSVAASLAFTAGITIGGNIYDYLKDLKTHRKKSPNMFSALASEVAHMFHRAPAHPKPTSP